MDDNKENQFHKIMDDALRRRHDVLTLTFDAKTLDLIEVKSRLEKYQSLAFPFPSYEEVDAITESLQFHLRPDVPLNIRHAAAKLQQEWVNFHTEILLYLGEFER